MQSGVEGLEECGRRERGRGRERGGKEGRGRNRCTTHSVSSAPERCSENKNRTLKPHAQSNPSMPRDMEGWQRDPRGGEQGSQSVFLGWGWVVHSTGRSKPFQTSWNPPQPCLQKQSAALTITTQEPHILLSETALQKTFGGREENPPPQFQCQTKVSPEVKRSGFFCSSGGAAPLPPNP